MGLSIYCENDIGYLIVQKVLKLQGISSQKYDA